MTGQTGQTGQTGLRRELSMRIPDARPVLR